PKFSPTRPEKRHAVVRRTREARPLHSSTPNCHRHRRAGGKPVMESYPKMSIGIAAPIRSFCLGALACGLVSCLKPFDVNVTTPEPIKVDLSMDVHVYQHGQPDTK